MDTFYFEAPEKLAPKAKYKAFATGIVLVIAGIAGMIAVRFITGNFFYYLRILSYIFIVSGALWMLRGILGQQLFSASDFIKISDDKISIGKTGKKPVIFNVRDMENVSLSDFSLLVKMKDGEDKIVALHFIPVSLLPELHSRLAAFAKNIHRG